MTSNGEQRQSIWKWTRWLAAAASAGVVIYLMGWRVPDVLVRHHADPSVESAYISAVATLLGVAATAAVAIFAFWYSRTTNQATINAANATTDKTVAAARVTNQATIDAAREAQFPDRYSKAVEQLGSSNLDVRIGGIYALEGIAVDYAKQHPTVVELLAAFIREHSREQWPVPQPGVTDSVSGITDAIRRATRPDVQAAVTVIGRRDASHDRQGQHVNLRGAELYSATLTDANLTDADLFGANLTDALLWGADLTGASLPTAEPPRRDPCRGASQPRGPYRREPH